MFVQLPRPFRISTASMYALALAALCLACPALGQGVIFVDDDATGANDGSSWCDAYVYLQDALAYAVGSAGSITEIRVAQGIYRPDQGANQAPGDRRATFGLLSGVALRGGYAGCGGGDPDERDIEAYETILSGDLSGDDDLPAPGESDCCNRRDTPGCDDALCQELVCTQAEPDCCEDWWGGVCANIAERLCCELCRPTRCENSYRVVSAVGPESSGLLDGFTIMGGEGNGESPFLYGGGLYAYEASPTVVNCTFTDNVAIIGSAMFVWYGDPVIANSTFIENGWFSPVGWAALVSRSGEPEIEDCAFIRNRGGGLRSEGSRPITACTFVENTVGGGLRLSGGAPNIIDCTFIRNEAYHGGGVHSSWGFPQLINCRFHGNSAGSAGGGLFNNAWGVILVNCVFSGNTAGGFVLRPGWPPSPGTGGALRNGWASALVLNSTFVGNSAGTGGGMVGLDGSTIAQSIFWGNWDDWGMSQSAQLGGGEYPPDIDYSCVQGWTGTLGGEGNVRADPLFADADGADDIAGTEDDNFRLSADSPLINAGDPDPPLVPYLDADGHERTLCGRVDMGAYEFGIGDYDCNRIIELIDFAAWDACMTGPDNGPFDSGCEAFDFDASAIGDIDLKDFAGFQLTLAARQQR